MLGKIELTKYRTSLSSIFEKGIFLIGFSHFLMFLFVVLSRIGYRYELEWTEGSILVQINHLLQGGSTYSAPTPEHVPYLYTPLYFWFGALASQAGGGFLPLRIISLGATLLSMLLIFRWIFLTTRSKFSAALAVFLFASAFKPTGYWFDLARVDTLFLLFILLGLRFLFLAPTFMNGFLGALALVLAFMTKQTSVLLVIVMLPVVILKAFKVESTNRDSLQKKLFLVGYLLTTVFGITGSILLLNWNSNGWFNYYAFKVPAKQELIPSLVIGFWTHDLIPNFAVPLGLTCFALYQSYKTEGVFSEKFCFRFCASAGMIGIAWMTRIHNASWDNVLIPAFVWLSVMAAWGFSELLPLNKWKWSVFGVLFFVQFVSLAYDPRAQIPTAEDKAEGAAIEAKIRMMSGEVWVPQHEYLAEWNGKKSYGNRMPMDDLFAGQGGNPTLKLQDSIKTLLREKRFAAILLDWPEWAHAGLIPQGEFYSIGDSLPIHGRAFYPKTGVKTRPIYFYLPNKLSDKQKHGASL